MYISHSVRNDTYVSFRNNQGKKAKKINKARTREIIRRGQENQRREEEGKPPLQLPKFLRHTGRK